MGCYVGRFSFLLLLSFSFFSFLLRIFLSIIVLLQLSSAGEFPEMLERRFSLRCAVVYVLLLGWSPSLVLPVGQFSMGLSSLLVVFFFLDDPHFVSLPRL